MKRITIINVLIIILIILCFLLGFLTYKIYKNQNKNSIVNKYIVITYRSDMEKLDIQNLQKIDINNTNKIEPCDFSITNVSNEVLNYKLKINQLVNENSSKENISFKNMQYYLSGENKQVELISISSKYHLVDQRKINPGETVDYELLVGVNKNYKEDIQHKYFKYEFVVEIF